MAIFASYTRYLDERFAHLETKIAGLHTLMSARFLASDETLKAAKEGLNEMRQMALDSQNLFMPRAEFEAKHDALSARVDRMSALEPRAEGFGAAMRSAWVVISGILIIVIAAFSAYFASRRGG